MKPLIVGELNPYGSDPRAALFPLPRNASGDRLRQHLGLTDSEYLRLYDRENLCAGKFDPVAARAKAKEILGSGRDKIITCGLKVSVAFNVAPIWFSVWPGLQATFLILPHPSGRCREWNRPGTAGLLRQRLRELGWP